MLIKLQSVKEIIVLSIRTVLHATDFSELSRGAYCVASSLAKDYEADLIVLHVQLSPDAHSDSGPNVPPKGNMNVPWQELERLRLADPSLRVQFRVAQGSPADEILRWASENKVDMIVLGTHGRGGLRRAIMGSVAEKVLRLAPCPVMTVNSAVAMAEVAVHESAVSAHGVCCPSEVDILATDATEEFSGRH